MIMNQLKNNHYLHRGFARRVETDQRRLDFSQGLGLHPRLDSRQLLKYSMTSKECFHHFSKPICIRAQFTFEGTAKAILPKAVLWSTLPPPTSSRTSLAWSGPNPRTQRVLSPPPSSSCFMPKVSLQYFAESERL